MFQIVCAYVSRRAIGWVWEGEKREEGGGGGRKRERERRLDRQADR